MKTSPSVVFDLDGDGILERCAWTPPGEEVAFLVLDRNGNGTIDDGSELFGTATKMRDGTNALNGFMALLDLDGGVGVSDGQISPGDPLFGQLRLWIDRNHNGMSEPTELLTLTEAGVAAIYTGYWPNWRRDRHGNRYGYEGNAVILKPEGPVQRRVFDVFLRYTR